MSPPELKQKALRLLARREYSRVELGLRLLRDEGQPDEVDAVLSELEAEGWLSDSRYVEQILNARLGRYGREHVLHELRSKGIGEDLIRSAMPRIMDAQIDALKSIWQRKFGKIPENRKELAQQVRFLQGRGFSLDEIFGVIGHTED